MEKLLVIMVLIMTWALIIFMVTYFASEVFKSKRPFWDTLMTVFSDIILGLTVILLLFLSFMVIDKYIW